MSTVRLEALAEYVPAPLLTEPRDPEPAPFARPRRTAPQRARAALARPVQQWRRMRPRHLWVAVRQAEQHLWVAGVPDATITASRPAPGATVEQLVQHARRLLELAARAEQVLTGAAPAPAAS